MTKKQVGSLEKGLSNSKLRRKACIEKFGTVPLSILKLSRGALSRRMMLYQSETPGRRGGTEAYLDTTYEGASEEAKAVQREREAKGLKAARYSRNPSKDRIALSIMPAELVRYFLRFYAGRGSVYVDPFVGQGVQMQVALLEGVRYYGYDASEEFVSWVLACRDRLDPEGKETSITLGDSRSMDEVPDAVGDFCFTSPPYWDVEFYGTEEAQLGHGKTYEEFLEGMQEVATELRRKMKPGGVAVINVNDFRRNGRFYSYHSDTIRLFQAAGWTMSDCWIIEGLIGSLPRAFAPKLVESKIAPKVHEFALVFTA